MGQLRELVEKAFATGYDAGDLDGYMRNFTADCEVTFLGTTFHGREQFKEMLGGFAAAFSDSHHAVTNAVEDGDRLASEILWSATHSGTLHTPAGDIPPTEKRVRWAMCMVDRFESGLITSRHIYLDPTGPMNQLGAG